MPERSCLDPSGASGHWDNRDALGDGMPAKEPLPAYHNITEASPVHSTQPAPTSHEPATEWRWTAGPRTERERTQRWRNNLNPVEVRYLGQSRVNESGRGRFRDSEQSAEEVGENTSGFACIELGVRVLSWLMASAAFSTAIYVSAHVKALRQAAALGQLAALFPLALDSFKVFSLLTKGLKKTSSGNMWYADLLCMLASGLVCSFFWRFGVRDNVFEPFGEVNEVTVAIAFMATNGAFRFIWCIIPLSLAVMCCGGGS